VKNKVPAGWSWCVLRDVMGPPQYGLSLAASPDGNMPMIGMKDMVHGRIVDAPRIKVLVDDEQQREFRLNRGDLLLNRTNSPALVGKLAIWERNENAVFASYLVRYPARFDVALPQFTIAALCMRRSAQQIERLITPGVSQSNINPNAFYDDVKIALPPLPEQERILRVINFWDKAIDQTERLIVAKSMRYRGLLDCLCSPAFIDQMSDDWTPYKLGFVFTERDERSGVLPLLAITGQRGVVPRDALDRRQTASEDKSDYKVIRPGDIGYNTMRMWQGVFGRSNHTGIVSPAYTVVTARDGMVDPVFASHLFGHPKAISLFHRYSQGLVDDTLMLKFPQFSEIAMRLPSIHRQFEIGKVLETEESTLGPQDQYLAYLRTQKLGLMQKLLSGEWRLNERFDPQVPVLASDGAKA
jgi:type I restriction enzyme S subunit